MSYVTETVLFSETCYYVTETVLFSETCYYVTETVLFSETCHTSLEQYYSLKHVIRHWNSIIL